MRKIPEPEKLRDYWLALGKFIQRYAEVEFALSQVLRIASNTTYAHAAALFSGARVKDAMATIKRLHEADKKQLDPWLTKAFSKLGEITTIRDNLLHYGIQADGDALLNTNKHRTLETRVFRRKVRAEDLNDLEADIITIHACLNMHQLDTRFPRAGRSMKDRERQIALSPWRCKLLQPTKSRGSSRRKAQEQ